MDRSVVELLELGDHLGPRERSGPHATGVGQSLGKAGIRMFEYGPPMLHAKTMVIDDTVAIIGTANLDNRSFRLNFEIAAAFYDATVIKRLVNRFEEDRALSKPFSRRRGEKLTVFLESLARLTSPVL